jgi:hypothetical protein
MRGLFFIIIFSLITSCNYRVSKQSSQPGNESFKTPPPETTPIDAALVKNYALSTCFDCHSGRKQPTLNSLDAIRSNIDSISTEVTLDSMPPQRDGYLPLSDCQKAVLERWIELGMPDQSAVTMDELPACASHAPAPGA